MPEVFVDGTCYMPAHSIGIAVTTQNRTEVFQKSLAELRKHSHGLPIVVVDDGSSTPVPDADFRFDKPQGIAVAKNKCLELLDDLGVDHFFLFDDDAYPLVDGWWEPYVASPEPHLMAVYDKPKGQTKTQVEVLYKDSQHVAYHATRGYMLYVHRPVLDVVGGMDPAFGKWGWEHQSWSDRIHVAGLTSWRYADVIGSDKLFYSMDQHAEVKSTATDEAKRFSTGPGLELRMASRNSPEFIPFRQPDDVVLTAMLCAQNDPQRGTRLPAKAQEVKALHDSLKHDGRFVVLTTGLQGELPKAELVEVEQSINPYFERWLQIYKWLRANPQVGRVWCVDATDVQMTRDPFPEMEPGQLYFGYEPTTLRDEWMVAHHPDKTLQKFMKDHANLPLLNMGVVGGDRDTVMRFAHGVSKMWFDDHIDWIYGWETGRLNDGVAGDMAAGNYLARTVFADVVSSGPHVTNVFKSNAKSPVAWFKHK